MAELRFEDIPGKWRCGKDYLDMRVTGVSLFPVGPALVVYVCNMQTDWDGAPDAYGPHHLHPREKAIANAGPDAKAGWYGVVAMTPQEAAKKGLALATSEKKDVHGRYPIIQGAGQPKPGMYISKTSLPAVGKEHLPIWDQNRYPNAAEVPFGAISGGLDRCGLSLGDRAVSMRPDVQRFVEYPFMDSSGHSDKLGEVSKAVITALGSSEHITLHIAMLRSASTHANTIFNNMSYCDNPRDLPAFLAFQLEAGPKGDGLARFNRYRRDPATSPFPRITFERILMCLWKLGYHF